MTPEDEVVRETLAALEMPAKGVRHWLAADLHFCKGHGGERVYGELMAILERHERALPPAGPPS